MVRSCQPRASPGPGQALIMRLDRRTTACRHARCAPTCRDLDGSENTSLTGSQRLTTPDVTPRMPMATFSCTARTYTPGMLTLMGSAHWKPSTPNVEACAWVRKAVARKSGSSKPSHAALSAVLDPSPVGRLQFGSWSCQAPSAAAAGHAC